MKRLLMVIFALLLLLDLADDGCFGKANLDPHHYDANTVIISLNQSPSGKMDFQHEFPAADLPEAHSHQNFPSIYLYFRVQPSLKLIVFSQKSSSGGIPL